jgi:hypothetical protein
MDHAPRRHCVEHGGLVGERIGAAHRAHRLRQHQEGAVRDLAECGVAG